MEYSSITDRINTRLPSSYWAAHQLCFFVHDVMAQLLVSGRRASAFKVNIKFRDKADRLAFEKADNVFVWLEQSRRVEERARLLITSVFPAVLGETLEPKSGWPRVSQAIITVRKQNATR